MNRWCCNVARTKDRPASDGTEASELFKSKDNSNLEQRHFNDDDCVVKGRERN